MGRDTFGRWSTDRYPYVALQTVFIPSAARSLHSRTELRANSASPRESRGIPSRPVAIAGWERSRLLESEGSQGWQAIGHTAKIMALWLRVYVEVCEAFDVAAKLQVHMVGSRKLVHGHVMMV